MWLGPSAPAPQVEGMRLWSGLESPLTPASSLQKGFNLRPQLQEYQKSRKREGEATPTFTIAGSCYYPWSLTIGGRR